MSAPVQVIRTIKYAKHEGPESVEGDVVKANDSADGKLVWSKANLKD